MNYFYPSEKKNGVITFIYIKSLQIFTCYLRTYLLCNKYLRIPCVYFNTNYDYYWYRPCNVVSAKSENNNERDRKKKKKSARVNGRTLIEGLYDLYWDYFQWSENILYMRNNSTYYILSFRKPASKRILFTVRVLKHFV